LVAASDFGDELLLDDDSYLCAYPTSVAYRIYSACCSFYIPLIVCRKMKNNINLNIKLKKKF
jgi:hypothetical protein